MQFNTTKPNRNWAAGRGGFTLVEMLLVLVILATLAAVVVPKFAGRSKQAKVTSAKVQISNFEIAIDAFEIDMGYYPKAGNDLLELMEEPNSNNAQDWKGPYLKTRISKDPWGEDYVYVYPGKQNVGSYDLYSAGPDMQTGTEDDITNWQTEDR